MVRRDGHGKPGRRFTLNRRTGRIAVQRNLVRERLKRASLERADLLAALSEVEVMISPALAADRVPPDLSIAFLADGMYGRLTGEPEIPLPDLRVRLCQFILIAWQSGWFVPSAAFPYSFEQVIATFEALPEDEVGNAVSTNSAQLQDQQSGYFRLKEEMKDIDAARDNFLRLGRKALRSKRFDLAEKHFRRAVEEDVLDESEACYLLALTRLWQRDFYEAAFLFSADQEDREGEAPLSWFFSEWCACCSASSSSAYLASLQAEMDEDQQEDPLAYKAETFLFDYGVLPDSLFQNLAAVLFAAVRGQWDECLRLLSVCEQASSLREIPPWIVPFWQALARVGLGQITDAEQWLKRAQSAEIPPLLFLPLRWFEQSQPAFYAKIALPLFESYALGPQIAEITEREQLLQQEHLTHAQWWIEQQS